MACPPRIPRVSHDRRGSDWLREAEAIEGIRYLGVETGGSKKARIESRAAPQERSTLLPVRTIGEPAHYDRCVDDEGRRFRQRELLPSACVTRLHQGINRVGQPREIDAPAADAVVNRRDTIEGALDAFGREWGREAVTPGLRMLRVVHHVASFPSSEAHGMGDVLMHGYMV